MHRHPHINYDFTPSSYWDDSNLSLLHSLLRNIKGTQRRDMIVSAWNKGELDRLADPFFEPELPDFFRDQMGEIHPLFLAGELLPPYLEGEIEIARIELHSVTGDVTSIRARPGSPDHNAIFYRALDEHQGVFIPPTPSSETPLSLGEIIHLIDHTHSNSDFNIFGLAFSANHELRAGGASPDRLRKFTRVVSDYYPDLESHYALLFEQWADGEFDT